MNLINSECEFNSCKKNNEFTEGYLHDTYFNGVLFVMREPNSENEEADAFWFKSVVNDEDKSFYNTKCITRKDKSGYTKYKERLNEYLQRFCDDISEEEKELKYCAYINFSPKSGGAVLSDEYQNNFDDKKIRVFKIIEHMKPKIIFTCNFNDFEVEEKVPYLEYNKKRTLYKGKYNGIEIYEIAHPSRAKALKKQRILSGNES